MAEPAESGQVTAISSKKDGYEYATKLLHHCNALMKPKNISIIILAPVLLIALFSGEAMALQTHDGAEGVVVHQLAHIQYLGALGYLLWDIRRRAFAGIGWLYLQRFCWLMMFWNGIAFIGHFAQVALPGEAICTEDGYLSALLLLPVSFGKYIYYITALDHLLCTPALFFLFLAMRSFCRSLDKENREDAK
jgi:hypothetical protein